MQEREAAATAERDSHSSTLAETRHELGGLLRLATHALMYPALAARGAVPVGAVARWARRNRDA